MADIILGPMGLGDIILGPMNYTAGSGVVVSPMVSLTEMGGVSISSVSAPTVAINGMVSDSAMGSVVITQVDQVYYSDRIVVF